MRLSVEIDDVVLREVIDDECREGECEDRVEERDEPEKRRAIDEDQDDRYDAESGEEERRVDRAECVEEISQDATGSGDVSIDFCSLFEGLLDILTDELDQKR
ncbi:unannotated protein [freshwater metagenome]|uniref:Unannotated protein n=1 Tax=freshwater metagenome TaxID=449393 RepID=A0A6J6DUL4_9ZZZZ